MQLYCLTELAVEAAFHFSGKHATLRRNDFTFSKYILVQDS